MVVDLAAQPDRCSRLTGGSRASCPTLDSLTRSDAGGAEVLARHRASKAEAGLHTGRDVGDAADCDVLAREATA